MYRGKINKLEKEKNIYKEKEYMEELKFRMDRRQRLLYGDQDQEDSKNENSKKEKEDKTENKTKSRNFSLWEISKLKNENKKFTNNQEQNDNSKKENNLHRIGRGKYTTIENKKEDKKEETSKFYRSRKFRDTKKTDTNKW